jgi:hypothetical protein
MCELGNKQEGTLQQDWNPLMIKEEIRNWLTP